MSKEFARVLMSAGFAMLREEVQERCREVEGEPLGYLYLAGRKRLADIKAEGREPTNADFAEFLEEVPSIVASARHDKRKGKGKHK